MNIEKNTQKKTAEEWGLRAEKAVVIIYDSWGQRFLTQQKDAGYPIVPFQHMYSFFGAGIKPTPRETPMQAVATKLENLSGFFSSKVKTKSQDPDTSQLALQARLAKELKAVHGQVLSNMHYWKKFRLPYGSGIDGEYTLHAYIMLTNKKGLDDLKYATEGDGGARQGSLALIHRHSLERPNSGYPFLGSLDKIIPDFLRELDMGAGQFLQKLEARENKN